MGRHCRPCYAVPAKLCIRPSLVFRSIGVRRAVAGDFQRRLLRDSLVGVLDTQARQFRPHIASAHIVKPDIPPITARRPRMSAARTSRVCNGVISLYSSRIAIRNTRYSHCITFQQGQRSGHKKHPLPGLACTPRNGFLARWHGGFAKRLEIRQQRRGRRPPQIGRTWSTCNVPAPALRPHCTHAHRSRTNAATRALRHLRADTGRIQPTRLLWAVRGWLAGHTLGFHPPPKPGLAAQRHRALRCLTALYHPGIAAGIVLYQRPRARLAVSSNRLPRSMLNGPSLANFGATRECPPMIPSTALPSIPAVSPRAQSSSWYIRNLSSSVLRGVPHSLRIRSASIAAGGNTIPVGNHQSPGVGQPLVGSLRYSVSTLLVNDAGDTRTYRRLLQSDRSAHIAVAADHARFSPMSAPDHGLPLTLRYGPR